MPMFNPLNLHHHPTRFRKIGMRLAVRLLVLSLLFALAQTSQAQDPLKVAPEAYKLQFENDSVRVIRVHYAPLVKLPTHDHPQRPAVFVYLNDGGAVKFQHVEGVSGTYAAKRPPTKAGGFRLAGLQPENHQVENLSEVPSEFLQIEMKTEAAELKTFRGKFLPDPNVLQGNSHKVEFDNPQIRITRIVCQPQATCDMGSSEFPALLVAFAPLQYKSAAKNRAKFQAKLDTGQTKWLGAGTWGEWQNTGKTPAHHLLIEFKTKPAAPKSAEKKEGHKHS